MGRGRKSFSFHLPELPERVGAVSLVWRGGYELHIVVPAPSKAEAPIPSDSPAQAAVDLGEIHQASVTTSTGQGLIVTGRGMRSIKWQHNQLPGQLSRLQARCQQGSKRWWRLKYTRARESGKSKRRVRDMRHKGTRQAVDFCRDEGGADALRWRPAGGAQGEQGAPPQPEDGAVGVRSGQAVSPAEIEQGRHRVLQRKSSGEPAAAVLDATGSRSREEAPGPGLRCGFVGHRDTRGEREHTPPGQRSRGLAIRLRSRIDGPAPCGTGAG
jgi:putative transposase